MASSKEYLNFILEQLSSLNESTYRAMMDEYIIYYGGKIIEGIYRFLVESVSVTKRLMPDAKLEPPYERAKEMLLVDDVDDKEFLTKLIIVMYNELPMPKSKTRN